MISHPSFRPDFRRNRSPVRVAIAVGGMLISIMLASAEDGIPPESRIARGAADQQRLLLNPMDDPLSVRTGAWKLQGTYVTACEHLPPKLGSTVLTLGAEAAEQAGAKGDFRVRENVPGKVRLIGMWAYLTKGSNVEKMGVQVHDAQGEVLMALVPAQWNGWKWVELDLGDAEQAYPQTDKNQVADYPLQSVHVVWFTKDAGPTSLAVDAIVALTDAASGGGRDITVDVSAPESFDPGGKLPLSFCATNFTKRPMRVMVQYSLQRDSALYSATLPDPVYGSNHAANARSWLVVDGETIEDSSSTDGKEWTSTTTPWQREHYTEAMQLVDLGRVREVRKLSWLSGDANHAWRVDVWASEDGESFVLVPGLSDVDQHKKWGWQEFPLEQPFSARVLKCRHKTTGRREDLLAFPSELGVYDGAADEAVGLPQVGTLIEEEPVVLHVPAQSYTVHIRETAQELEPGAYLLGLSVQRDGSRDLSYRHVFSGLNEEPELVSGDSRIGLNVAEASLAPRLRTLGIGYVRFENGKWPFVSDQPHRYFFTGEVAPWHLNLDEIFHSYRDAGFSVLTYMFLTPTWASTAPKDVAAQMRLSFPPQDPSWYGEFCFQMAARYGSKQHPADVLLTSDKRSGLNLVKYYEMWNEPNLNPSPTATWGGWAAPMDDYYEMMRFGAEAVKRADPNAMVTSAGYAGMSIDVVDPLRTYRYPDKKCPLDFVDVLNVHFYSGQEPPETCRTDGNANVTSSTTFPENLRELALWRDHHAPGMPIWMTETGYDSAGPFGTTESIQAARLPRVVMLCLAHGIDKVFVYRESGSTPSQHACSGVLREDFSRKPSWYTLGTMIRQLHGVRGGACRMPHPDPNVWLLDWDTGGEPLITAWTVDDTARLGIELGGCTVTDSFGGAQAVDSTRELQVTPYPQYLRGFTAAEPLERLQGEYERQEAARRARQQRIAALRKYLFDFGSTDHVGRCDVEGHKSDYLPVLSTTVWEEQRGYGFDKPALQDDDQPWMANQKLDRDGTRVRDHVFQFRVAPGLYDLELCVVPFQEQGQVTISGIEEGPLVLDVDKKDPVQRVRIGVAAGDGVINIRVENDYAHFRWISCIEAMEP